MTLDDLRRAAITQGLLLAVFLVSGNCAAFPAEDQRPGDATSRWIALMATTYYEPRTSSEVQTARFAEVLREDELLTHSLPKRPAPSGGLIHRPGVLSDYRSVWKADRLDQDALAIRIARIRQLSLSIADAWRPKLSAVNAVLVSDDLALVLIADVAELFPGEKFDAGLASAALTRLAIVPRDAAQSLANVLNMERAYAAVLIIQNHDFFGAGGFDRPAVDAAVARIVSSRR